MIGFVREQGLCRLTQNKFHCLKALNFSFDADDLAVNDGEVNVRILPANPKAHREDKLEVVSSAGHSAKSRLTAF